MPTRLSGDLAISIAGPQATQADVEIVRKAYGLDRPLYVQFFTWVGRAAVGDFGQSYFFKDSVANLIARRMPITLTLGLVGLSLALIISIPLGILAAIRENTWLDRAVTMFTMVGQAVPSFWLALILMIVLGLQLGVLPISGTGTWQHFVMPGIVLAFTAIPALTRLTRSGMIEAMASDYIRTARAKGLSRARIIFRHALRNAAIPVVSIAAVQLGFMLGGSIVIETVFAQLGRDYLARLVYGARISLLIGIMTVITSGAIGITLGVVGGFFGGRVDDVVLFAITTRLSIPVVLVALAVVGLLGSGLGLVVATLGLLLWDRFAVVARATTMQVRTLDYVSAAWCAGASTSHILIKEILPNIASHLAVVATLEMALAILLEAALSFLGLGVPPPLPSWGLMIAEGKDYMFFSPWVIMIPGVAPAVLVLGINLVAAGLCDLLGARTDQ